MQDVSFHPVLKTLLAACLLNALGCSKEPDPSVPVAEPAAAVPTSAEPSAAEPGAAVADTLRERAKALFAPMPAAMQSRGNPLSDAKIDLGRALYFETRLSKNHDLSCNSCHDVTQYGVDVRPESGATSSGHRGQKGGRNSPTVYNAALHVAQFWDGRAENVEEQAKGPILNPIEMALPDEAAALAVLNSIPGYGPLFKAAFPAEADPVSYDNVGKAIGAFERKLITPSPFDAFLGGDDKALDEAARGGLALFMDTGCTACHSGPALGGAMYQKLGLLKPYKTQDTGRFEHTKNEADKFFFKVPSLRNIEKTGPYFHDGSIATLQEAVRIMARHQTAKGELSDAEVASLMAFLTRLTGELPAGYIKAPQLPESGPQTPKADPS